MGNRRREGAGGRLGEGGLQGKPEAAHRERQSVRRRLAEGPAGVGAKRATADERAPPAILLPAPKRTGFTALRFASVRRLSRQPRLGIGAMPAMEAGNRLTAPGNRATRNSCSFFALHEDHQPMGVKMLSTGRNERLIFLSRPER